MHKIEVQVKEWVIDDLGAQVIQDVENADYKEDEKAANKYADEKRTEGYTVTVVCIENGVMKMI